MSDTDGKVAQLLDRTAAALPESIRGVWALSGGDDDPWGDAMAHAFALNDLAHLVGATTDRTYSPGCGVSWDDTDSWPDDMYRDDYRAGLISADDVAAAIPVLSTLCHGLELLGLNY